MLERGQGYLLQTASAAGLLINLGDAAYTATKHAAVGLAEWLSATYRHRGIGVSCLCPMGVDTDMLAPGRREGIVGQRRHRRRRGALARRRGRRRRRRPAPTSASSCSPTPRSPTSGSGKADDPDRWLAAMNRVQQTARGLAMTLEALGCVPASGAVAAATAPVGRGHRHRRDATAASAARQPGPGPGLPLDGSRSHRAAGAALGAAAERPAPSSWTVR